MRPFRNGDDAGSVVVGFVLFIPMIVGLVVGVLLVGMAAYERAKLQAAVDMAAYAGSASLAHSLNKIATRNRNIYEEFLSFKKDYGEDSQQNAAAADQRFAQYKNTVQKNIDEVKQIISEMGERARGVTLRNMELNSSARSTVEVVGEVSVENGGEEDVTYSKIIGSLFIDPENHDEKSVRALINLVKKRSFPPTVIFSAVKNIKTPIAKNFLPELSITAGASATAFGGSVEEYAFSKDEAEKENKNRSWDWLYAPALSGVVPSRQ